MEVKNRMQTHPVQTMEMDLLGLQRRANPLREARPDETVLRLTETPHQGGRMRSHEVVLRLKEDTLSTPNQSANWAATRRALAEAARKFDLTCASLGVRSSIEEQVNTLMEAATNPLPTTSGKNYLMDIANARVKQFQEEDRAKRWAQEIAAAAAVPLAKRTAAGFQKVY